MKIILASNNAGKIREFSELLNPFDIELITQSQLGIKDVEETGLTFVENALIKARHAARESGLPALADDSGLAVAALSGEPGIYSARYAGDNASASENIEKLLTQLKKHPEKKRDAAFHCVLIFMTHAKDPIPLICDGIWSGIIIDDPKGQGGFGYDPVFYIPSEKKTAAELPSHVKNKISHRGRALQLLLKKLPEKINESTLS